MIFMAVIPLVCVVTGSFIWLYATVTSSTSLVNPVELSIPRGASTPKIADSLMQHHVITSPLAFRLYARITGRSAKLRSGYYRFEGAASIQDILVRLVQGDVIQFQVSIPEGLRNDEILDLLAGKTGLPRQSWQNALMTLLPDQAEGRLLPETYRYTRPVDPQVLLKSMLRAQQSILNKLSGDKERQQRLRIMASIIEKETALAEERPLVAAVIVNRLRKHMPLQMDPTVIYGLWKTDGAFSGNIHRKDLKADNPWNTYTRRGLPPTPIGNPGAASIRAAAYPAEVDYLYFVADGRGGHAFAATFEEHQANVRKWMSIERRQNEERNAGGR